MKNKNNKNVLSRFFISLLFLLITIFNFQIANAQGNVTEVRTPEKYGLTEAATHGGLITNDSDNQDIILIVSNIVGYALYFTGSIFFILIIIAGFTWMTAGGEEKKVSSAKGKIKGAIMGIVVILCAYIITTFVFNTLKATIETDELAPPPADNTIAP